MRWNGRVLKTGLLLGWAMWLSVVTLTNITDALKALDVLGDDYSFASGNWPYLEGTTSIHDTPGWIDAVLFGGVIGWQLLGSFLFWSAWLAYRRGVSRSSEPVMSAFIVSAALWFAFTVADEIFFAFDAENTHRLILVALLASLVVMHVVPDGDEASALRASDASRPVRSPGLGTVEDRSAFIDATIDDEWERMEPSMRYLADR